MELNSIQQFFPNPTKEEVFIAQTASTLANIGFTRDNTLPVLAVCRDEICADFIHTAEKHWGNSFTLGGLGGLPFGGKTEMWAASLHAPDIYDRKRFVIYAMAHIAFGPQGEIGGCMRPGMKNISGACGALIVYTKQLAEDDMDMTYYSDDAEFALLKHRMSKVVPEGAPDLLTVTASALTVIKQDILSLTSTVLDTKDTDYAVFTGTQIHLPDGNYVQPSDSWVVKNGQRQNINFSA